MTTWRVTALSLNVTDHCYDYSPIHRIQARIITTTQYTRLHWTPNCVPLSLNACVISFMLRLSRPSWFSRSNNIITMKFLRSLHNFPPPAPRNLSRHQAAVQTFPHRPLNHHQSLSHSSHQISHLPTTEVRLWPWKGAVFEHCGLPTTPR